MEALFNFLPFNFPHPDSGYGGAKKSNCFISIKIKRTEANNAFDTLEHVEPHIPTYSKLSIWRMKKFLNVTMNLNYYY